MANKVSTAKLQKRAIRRVLRGNVPKPLRPTSKQKLRKQATKLVGSSFKPALVDLNQQQRAAKSIDRKRASDNRFYLDWLHDSTEQLQAHADAAAVATRAAQDNIQKVAADSMIELRDNLATSTNPGTVTGPAQQQAAATGAVSGQAQASQDMIANERGRTEAALASADRGFAVGQASNFAQVAAMDAKRQADLYTKLKEISNTKTRVKLEKAAAVNQEVARLLDQEVAKAEARTDLRNVAGQFALEAKKQKIDVKRLDLDTLIADREYNLDLANLALDERRLENDIADDKADNERADLELDLSAKELKMESSADRKEVRQEVRHALNKTVQYIITKPNLIEAWSQSPDKRKQDIWNKLKRKLIKQGADPLIAQAALEQVIHGSIDSTTQGNLKDAFGVRG